MNNQNNRVCGHGRGMASGSGGGEGGGRGRGGRGRGRDDSSKSKQAISIPPPPVVTSKPTQNVDEGTALNNSGINIPKNQIVDGRESVASSINIVDNKQPQYPVLSKAKPAWVPQQPVLQQTPKQELSNRNINKTYWHQPTQSGTLGHKIALWTNHYKINFDTEKVSPIVHKYDVSIERSSCKSEKRPIKKKDLLKDIFRSLNLILNKSHHNLTFTDFSKNLYSLGVELPCDIYKVVVDDQEFNVKCLKTGEVVLNNSNQSDLDIIQILNIAMTHNLALTSNLTANRSFFKENFREIGLGIDLWKGTFASVRPSECGLTWNLNLDIAAFFSSENLLELAFRHYKCNNEKILLDMIRKDSNSQEIGVSFIELIKGREVKLSTTGFRKKIKSFAYANNGKVCDSFHQINVTANDGKTNQLISIKDYTEERYKINIKYPKLPCIDLSGDKNPTQVFVPMEICTTQPKHTKKLDVKQQGIVRQEATLRPTDRMKAIQKWADSCDVNKDPILVEFGINVDLRNRIGLDGRVLPPPDIQYGDRKCVYSSAIGERGSWNHSDMKFFRPVPVNEINWALINIAYDLNDSQISSFVNKVQEVALRHGIKGIGKPLTVKQTGSSAKKLDELEDMKQIFKSIFDEAKQMNKKLDMIVGFFSNENDRYYRTIKTCADLSEYGYGVATQCIKSQNVIACKDQVISNLLLKINSKLGGTNFVLATENKQFRDYLKPLFDENLMIFGADVTHPSPQAGSDLAESIAAVTASIDKDCSYYVTRLLAQRKENDKKQEMIIELDKVFKELILLYKDRNNVFPKRIVFFRDGVSEGEFNLILRYEINKIRAACAQISDGYRPAISFVVVQKRHQTRFFPKMEDQPINDRNGRNNWQNSAARSNYRSNDKPKPGNIPPGTTVDKEVTTPHLFDFFLCSHYGIQGTSKPCRYFVLHDENNFGMDKMTILAYYLCHIYSRTSRSVSYPAPAYYAHLAASRGREYIRKVDKSRKCYEIELNEKIKDTMFYT